MVGDVGGDMLKLYRIASSVDSDDGFDDEDGNRRLRRDNAFSWSGIRLFVRELLSRLQLRIVNYKIQFMFILFLDISFVNLCQTLTA